MTNLRSRSAKPATAQFSALHRLLHRLPLPAAALALALSPCFTPTAFAQTAIPGLPSSGGPVTISTSATADGQNTATGQFTLDGGASATITADGADTTVTFTNILSPNNSGAIYLNASSTLTLTGINGGNFLFTSNTGGNNGSGALYIGGTASLFIDHATFTNNGKTNASAGGVATLGVAAASLNLTNVLITGNAGGIYANGAQTILTIASSTIQNNTAAGTGANGGAVYYSTANNSNITLNDVLIDNNRVTTSATAAGIFSWGNAQKSTWNFTNVVFSNNSVAGTAINGGGFSNAAIAATSLVNLTNVTFTSNTASGLGGALFFNGGTFAYNATAGGAALIANNTAGPAATAAPSGIYFGNGFATPATFNAADGASIDMLDPMTSAATAAALTITKTGAGAWNLGGNSNLTTTAAFTVAAGALHLYRGGATNPEHDTTGAYTAQTGNLTLAGSGAAFNLADAATLSAGGGNTLTAPTITLGAASIIALDLAGAIANTSDSILTLNATTFNINTWSQTLNLLNPDALNASAGDIFNLITLAGAGAAANPFTTASFGGLGGIIMPTGYELQLAPDGLSLRLLFAGSGNHVLYWTGATGNTLWSDPANNWLAAGAAGGPASFARGDIINLADNTPTPTPDINVDPAAGVTIAGMYVSGNQNYTITGNSITASSTVGQFSGSAAATAQLILGAKAADNGDTIDATAAYTGTLTLSNTTNDFQAGILINTGALAGNTANLGSGTGGITIDTGTLIFDQDAANGTYSSTIRSAPTAAAGAGALVKTGTGRLTLNVDDSAFTGVTDINEGTLSLAAAGILGGAIHVNPNAMLGGSGTATGNVTINATGTLNIVAAPLTILGDLTLNAGAILNYAALSTDPAASTLQLGGALIQTGASTINLGVVALNTGSYSLINATAANALSAFDATLLGVNFQGAPLTYGANYDFTTDPAGILWLDILLVPLGRNNVLTWTGAAADNLWHTSTNWTALGAPIAFTQGDIVNLADTALATPATTITLPLADTATTAAIYISGNTSYTITGAQPLVTTTDAAATALAGTPAGTGKLVLGKTAADAATVNITPFTGTLDLTAQTTANNFANGVEINSGALRVSTIDQLGAPLSKLAFTGANANTAGALLIADNLTFDGAGGANNRLVLTASTAGAITLEDGKTLTLTNNLPGSPDATGTTTTPGAAINLATGASLTLNPGLNSWFVFTSNSAFGNGGAINNSGGALTITSATFANNLASNNSGAIHNTGTLTLSNVYFTSNTANLVAGGSNYTSGAITNSGNTDGVSASILTITNGYFEANNAYNGGAITNPAGTALTTTTITTSTFKNNTATFNGGAIQAAGGQTYVANSYFTGNFANNLGGALLLNAGAQATFVNDYFYANTAGTGAGGGAIAFSGTSANLLVQSSTIEANTALNGGGFQTNGNFSLATFENTDFLNNTATTLGGAIYVGPNSQASVVNLNVTTGTMRISGNKAAGTPNSIEWDSTANLNGTNSGTLAITTAAGAVLDMLDPMAVGMTAYGGLDILKNGAGTWKLSGNNTFNRTQTASTHAINFDINAGTLYLYGAGDPAAPNGAGNLAYNDTAPNTFTLHSGASLAPGGATWLTLTAPTLAIATGGLANFSLYLNTWTTGSYNLLAATQGSTNLATLLNDNAQSLLTTIGYNGLLPADTPTVGINTAGQLWIAFSSTDTLANEIVAWTGAANSNWYGANWTPRPNALFSQNDIVNLDSVSTTGPTTLNLAAPATIGALYLSGNKSYTLTGQSITTDTTAGTLKNTPANTGQLILGANARADATGIDTVAFTGTLTLSNTTNTFTNGILINTGALVGNAANLGAGTAGITIAAPGALTFDQAASGTYTATIRGAGALVKTNTAGLTLAADNSAFTGATTINAGRLTLAPAATLGGAITVNPTGTLAGAAGATAAGAVTVANGASLQVGSGATPSQTFSILGDLNLNAGSTLLYTGLNNLLTLGGALNLAGASTLDLGTLAFVTGSSYTLISDTGPGLLTGLDTSLLNVNYKGSALDTNLYTLTADTTGNLCFTLLGTALGANNVLTWTNATADNLWHASPNWLTAGLTKPFAQGDIVNLTDTSVNPQTAIQNPQSLTLAATATLSALYISGTTNYAIAGPGALVTATNAGQLAGSAAATGKLVLGKLAPEDATTPLPATFTGTLDLTGQTGAANNFTAGIEINTGALRVSTNTQLGATLKNLSFTYTGPATDPSAPALIVAPGGSLLFDGGSSDQSLVIQALATGAILLQPGATMTIQNMSTVNGGGITTNGSLSLLAAPDARFTFDRNTTTTRGGGILVQSGATLTLDGAAITNNNAGTGGGAIAIGGLGNSAGNSAATISHALIANNTSNVGGAIYVGGPNNTVTIASSTFSNNTTTAGNATNGGGGAINFTGNAGNANSVTATLTDVLFQGNISTSNNAFGGAVDVSTNIVAADLFLTRVLFASNTAASGASAYGGALAIMSPAANVTLTDVSLLNNHSAAAGGGIYFNGAAIACNVATSATIAGNAYGTTVANNTPNGLYLGVNAQTLAVDAAPGAHLDMIDPMAAANSNLTVTKTGAGTWNLSGANALGTSSGANIAFTVSGGVLHLYRAGETSGAYTAATGALTIGGGSFTLAPGATLSAGGGNTLNSPAITLAPDSIFSLDLYNAASGANATPVLTLNATTIDTGNWTQSLDLLNIDSLAPDDGSIYNLIALPGGATTFTDPSTFTLLNALPTGYSLLLSANSQTLELAYSAAALNNSVITWTGAAGNNLWSSANWLSAATGAPAGANRGDIVNIADSATPVASSTININTAVAAIVAGIYVSGTENQTIIGSPITSSSIAVASGTNFSTLIGTPAATGKLILGATATPDASAVLPATYTGTLTLANPGNVFDGGIEINSGALVGNALTVYTSTSARSVGIVIAAPGTLIIDQSFNHDYASPISGEGALIKNNTGALTLTSPNNAFTGSTTVNAGALLLDNATLGGPVQVASNATFGGAGSAGPLTVSDSATLQVGIGDAGSQTLSIGGALDLGAGDTLNYTALSNKLNIAGPVTRTGPSTINIPTLEAGTYDLGNISTLDDSYVTVNGRLIYSDARQKAILSTLGAELILTATGDISRALYWTGASGTLTWALTGTNWDSPATGDQYVFGNGDRVTFDDTVNPAAPLTANIIDDGVTVSDMTVNNTGNTTLTGEGITSSASSVFTITGNPANLTGATGKLYKTNTGTLTLNNNGNDFQGGIDLTGGALSIGGTTAATTLNATAATTLQMTAGGLLVTGTLAPAPGSTLTAIGTTGTIIFDNLILNTPAAAASASAAAAAAPTLKSQISNLQSLNSTNSVTAAIDAGDRLTLTGSATGDGGILKTGDGELRFTNAALGNTGATQIDAGAIRFTTTATTNTDTANGAIPAPATTQTILVNAGGTLALGTGNVAINDATARDWSGITLLGDSTGVITGANDIIHLASGACNALLTNGLIIAIDAGDSGTTALNNANNTFTGYVRADTGVLQITDLDQIAGPGSANTTKISLNGGAVQFSAPLPVNTIAGDIQMRPGTSTLIVDDGLTVAATRLTTATGVTNANSTLIKAGSGTLANLGAMAASALVIDQGRWIAVAGSPGAPAAVSGNYAPVTINDGAVLEMSIPTTGNAPAVLGLVGGAPYIPTASGTINNALMGSGTLEIKTGNLVLASPRSDIAHLNVTNGANIAITAPTFSPNGTITIDQGLLALAGDGMTTGNVVLANGARMGFAAVSGTVNLQLPSYSSTMVVYDPMGPGRTATLASLKADGGAADLYFNTNLAYGSADHLAINAPVSGTFNIHVTNLVATATTFTTTASGIVATPSPIVSTRLPSLELIHSPLTTTGTYLIDPNNKEIDADIYKYTVSDTTTATSYIVAITSTGALSNAADIINNAAAALPASWFSELENVTQRMGELHFDNRDAAKGGLAAWMRGNIEKLNYNNKVTAGAGSGFDEIHISGAAGLDYKTGDDTRAVYLGAYAGYGQSTRDRNTVASDVTSDSSFGGIYVTTAAKTGWYLDATAKFNRFKNSFTALAASTGETTTARYDNWAIGASVELGKYCQLPYDWFVEPQIQCAYTNISGATYTTSSSMAVQLLPASVTRAHAGLRVGRPIETGKYGTLSVYLKAYYGYQWTADGQVNIAPAAGQSYRTFAPAIKGTALEGGAGLAWILGARTQIYFDYDTTQADYYIKPYGLNLGIRHLW